MSLDTGARSGTGTSADSRMSLDTMTRPTRLTTRVTPRRDASGAVLLVGALMWALTVWLTVWTAITVPTEADELWRAILTVPLWLVALAALGIGAPLIRGVRYRAAAARAEAAGRTPEARAAAARATHDGWIAAGLCLPLVVLAVFAQFLAVNDHAVQSTFFDVPFMLQGFQDIILAFWTNIQIAVVAEIVILVWAMVIAIARLTPGRAGRPIRWIARAYTDIFRAVPSIIVIYLIGFGLPLAQVPVLSSLGPFWSAVLALTLIYGAYVSEVYRSGIEGVHWSQVAAARSLGLSYGKAMRFVVIPQALRRILPPLLNDFIGLQKDTALVTIIGTVEAFTQAKIYAGNYFNLSSVTVVAVLFIIITIPQTRFVDRLMERDTRAKSRS